jgi:hypothetical protein
VVGGGTVSVEVLGGSSPSAVSGGTVTASTTGVSLRTILGASSNLMAWSVPTVATKLNLWPPSSPRQAATEFNLGDGGFLDNTGLLATLQRGVKKAIVSLATDVVLPSSATYNACTASTPPTFATWPTINIGPLFNIDGVCGQYARCNNQVFEKSAAQELLCMLQTRAAAGEATVVTQTLKVLPNALWGIPAAQSSIKVVWVYLSAPAAFIDALPQETRDEIKKGDRGMFGNFPAYKTFGQNGVDKGFSLTTAQINLLAQLSSWMIVQSHDQITALLG